MTDGAWLKNLPRKATTLVLSLPLEGEMEELVYVLALLISVVALFALLRLFSISNDLKAIREHICNVKTNSDGLASAAKSGIGPQGS